MALGAVAGAEQDLTQAPVHGLHLADLLQADGQTNPGGGFAQFIIGPGTNLSIKDDLAAVKAANPSTYVSPDGPPFALFHTLCRAGW